MAPRAMKPNKRNKPDRHTRKLQKRQQQLDRMKANLKIEKAKDKIKIEKAKAKEQRAMAEYGAKSAKRHGMNDAQFNKWEREQKVKTREAGKREFQKAVAHNMKYGGLYNSINNTVEEIFDYPGWNIVNNDK